MRPDWPEYFLDIAEAVKRRGECRRSLVGAVLTLLGPDGLPHIVSTGYNGAAPGQPSCLDGVCPREQMGAAPGTLYADAPCIADHAERNAIRDAHRRGINIDEGVLYVTKEPCENCALEGERWGLRVIWRDLQKGTSGDTPKNF